ncbi:MAG: hypothetical protein EON90_02210 [Brevundimonas sp.]|nr:MAG: hypothetical protein EON90_02210 [Brevundimonas sp.]
MKETVMAGVLTWLKEQPLTATNFLIQRQVKNPTLRERAADWVARTRPAADTTPGHSAAALLESGIQPMDIVGPARAEEMRRYFEGYKVRDHYGKTPGEFLPTDAGPETHVGTFDDAVVLRAPHAVEIANHPAVLSAVSSALGARPIISSMTAWWSIPHAGAAREAELFHRDIDDWRFIKLFVYLTDVDEESGPHAYIPGSHRSDQLREIRRYSDEEVEAAYPDKCMRICGPAGDAFLENTQGLHRGIPPRSRLRLLFQVIYSLSKSPYGPARPIALRSDFPDLDLDPYVNQAYLK